MKNQKSKIKSIHQMWNTMQELTVKPNKTEVEEAALRVCTQFFICSEDFVQMFHECMDFIEESPPQPSPDRTSNIVKEAEDNALAMVAGMEVANMRPIDIRTSEKISDVALAPELEEQQLNEFHAMMNSMDFESDI